MANRQKQKGTMMMDSTIIAHMFKTIAHTQATSFVKEITNLYIDGISLTTGGGGGHNNLEPVATITLPYAHMVTDLLDYVNEAGHLVVYTGKGNDGYDFDLYPASYFGAEMRALLLVCTKNLRQVCVYRDDHLALFFGDARIMARIDNTGVSLDPTHVSYIFLENRMAIEEFAAKFGFDATTENGIMTFTRVGSEIG